jgi:hypothetical protein
MDEYEQQRRRDFINQVRINNRVAAQAERVELIEMVKKMKGPDRVARFRDDSEQRQRERKAADEARAQLTEQQRKDVAAVEQQMSVAIANAIIEERTFLVQLIGHALGQALDAEREAAKDELTKEVKALWSVLTEVQSAIASINRIAMATSGKSLTSDPDPLGRWH